MPKISVILCAYNAQAYLDTTIQSVLEQTFRDFELVVVDDGSTDSTGRIVAARAEQDPRIVYHYQPNEGFGGARNKAVALSRGDWIAIIDHDDLCLPRRLEIQLSAAERHPEAALIFCDTEHFLSDGTVVRRQFDSFNPCGQDLGAGAATDLLLERGCFVDSEAAFFRKELVAEVGGFRGDYRYINDYDFFLRVGSRHAFHGVDEVLARWRIHPGQLSQTARETMLREHIAVYREWLSRPEISPEARRAVKLRLCAGLFKAARFPALRRQHGGPLSLAREALRLRPSSAQDYLWCVERAREKLA